jgi:hypothetical protein
MRRRGVDIEGEQQAQIVRRKKALKSQFAGLQIVADHLNLVLPALKIEATEAGSSRARKEVFKAWQLVETIVSSASLAQSSEIFNRNAKNHPVTMFVEYPVMGIEKGTEPGSDRFIEKATKPPHTAVSSRDAIGESLRHLWLYYFRDHGWERLKRCQRCQDWFVDTAKNKSTTRCSAWCTARWWNRTRRKQQGHKQSTKRTKQRGGPNGTKKR